MASAQRTGPWAPHNGLQITRAFTSDYGPDAEEFNTIVSVNSRGVVIDYTDTRGTVARRKIRAEDRLNARGYLMGFADGLPNVIPGTTTLGISTTVLEQLRAEGQAPLALIYDTTLTPMPGRLTLVEQNIRVPVLVENQVVQVAALRANGTFKKGKRSATGKFVFLDDKNQPALIGYTIQFDFERRPRTVRTVRITSGRSQQAAMEQLLRTVRKLELYGIHFSFDSAALRPEARSLVADIATTLKNNPSWTLSIQGHTDSIGTPDYNQKLSERRAAAIMKAIIRRHKIDPQRLEAVGFGQSNPKASNDNLQGRALNRRVELVRTDR
ncbi:MAG: OmpA family protein [Hyphomicrobiales bacterium]